MTDDGIIISCEKGTLIDNFLTTSQKAKFAYQKI